MLRYFKRLSLLWKVLLCTSIVTTFLLGFTAWKINAYALGVTEAGVEEQVRASLQEYEFIWRAKVENLSRITLLLSTMSDVKRAFSTGDAATIRDAASDLWARVSEQSAIFLVLNPQGDEIASLGGNAARPASLYDVYLRLRRHFPEQGASFVPDAGHLYYMIFTPVYVQSAAGPALLNVLASGFAIDDHLATELKGATQGTDFVFVAQGRPIASTLLAASLPNAEQLDAAKPKFAASPKRVALRGIQYEQLTSPLRDDQGRTVGELLILRSFESSRMRFESLNRMITAIWLFTLAAGLVISYILARRLVQPLQALDRAAAEIANRNYEYRVEVNREDELGRLAQTFNSMCDSIQLAREELISQERLNVLGRISSSIVHDLRNPLAAIYGGAEMLVDTLDMAPEQSRRLATNIYRASRRIQRLLQDLTQDFKGSGKPAERCHLADAISSAAEIVSPAAQSRRVDLQIDAGEDVTLAIEGGRLQRVLVNLMNNAIEAMEHGGVLAVSTRREGDDVFITVDDNGPGLSMHVRKKLFQPFFSVGKRQGLGLGLALSRQTLQSYGGELWAAEKEGPGARFCLKLPLATQPVEAGSLPAGV
jgi:signal transduction histidine kinase